MTDSPTSENEVCYCGKDGGGAHTFAAGCIGFSPSNRQLVSDWINARTGELSIQQRVPLVHFAEWLDRRSSETVSQSSQQGIKHERHVVSHAGGWQEEMDTCVCGAPWPCQGEPLFPNYLEKWSKVDLAAHEQERSAREDYSRDCIDWQRRYITNQSRQIERLQRACDEYRRMALLGRDLLNAHEAPPQSTNQKFTDRFSEMGHDLIGSPLQHTKRYAHAQELMAEADRKIERLQTQLRMRPAPTADCECSTCFMIRQSGRTAAEEPPQSVHSLFDELRSDIDSLAQEAIGAGHPLGTRRAMDDARKAVEATIEKIRAAYETTDARRECRFNESTETCDMDEGCPNGENGSPTHCPLPWPRAAHKTTDEQEPCVSHVALKEWERMFGAWVKHQAGLPSEVALWPNSDWSQDVAMVAHALARSAEKSDVQQPAVCGKSFGDEWNWHAHHCTEPVGHIGPCKEDPKKLIAPTSIYYLISNDAYAASFQTMGQYRTALLKSVGNMSDCIADRERLRNGLRRIGELSASFKPVAERLLAGETIEQITGTPEKSTAAATKFEVRNGPTSLPCDHCGTSVSDHLCPAVKITVPYHGIGCAARAGGKCNCVAAEKETPPTPITRLTRISDMYDELIREMRRQKFAALQGVFDGMSIRVEPDSPAKKMGAELTGASPCNLHPAPPSSPRYLRPWLGTALMFAQEHRLAVTDEWARGWNACLDALDERGCAVEAAPTEHTKGE